MSERLSLHGVRFFTISLALLFTLIIFIRIQPLIEPRAGRVGLYAVFLSNGQVYFGNLTRETKERIRLERIYYFRTPGSSGTTQTDATLQKLGNEVHGPEDWMEIERAHILFLEKLKEDGKVANAIRAYAQTP